MRDRPNATSENVDTEDAADLAMTAIEQRMQQRRSDRRVFAALLLLITLVMSGFYGAFQWVESVAVDVDLRLSADAHAPVGEDVLVYAEVVDARSGQRRAVSQVFLEVWQGTTRVDRQPVHGALYHRVRITTAAQEIRLVRAMDGPVQSHAAVTVSAGAPAPARDRRGGMYAPAGTPGFRPIRREDACGWTVDAVALGGVPIANVPTEMLVRVSDAAGRGVADAVLRLDHREDPPQHARSDEDGFAVFFADIREMDYLEIAAMCDDAESRVGFEAQPVFDGLGITRWSQAEDVATAEVFDVTQRGQTRYDVRCEGVIRGMGDVPPNGTLPLSKDLFETVAAGTHCILQVYRGRFSSSASRTARLFQWGETSRMWAWQEHIAGIGRVGLDIHGRSLDADDATIAAWKESGYRRIRIGIATALALSLFLWFAFVLWGFRRRRMASRAQADLEMEMSATTVSTGLQSALWSGCVAIIVAYGGLYIVLMLMGL